MLGTHAIKAWSRTQSLIALSSGESELYAALKVAAETLGTLSMAKDFEWKLAGEVWGDASAALEIIYRKGVGKTRHIQIGLFWIQQTAAEQRLKFNKVLGTSNPADLFTKHLDEIIHHTHTKARGYKFTTGRAEEAPKLQGTLSRRSIESRRSRMEMAEIRGWKQSWRVSTLYRRSDYGGTS